MTRTEADAIRATVGAVVRAVSRGADSAARPTASSARDGLPAAPTWADGYSAGWHAAAVLAGLVAAETVGQLDNPDVHTSTDLSVP